MATQEVTYSQVLNLLGIGRTNAIRNYSQIPYLVDELVFLYNEGIQACITQGNVPRNIMTTTIWAEHRTIEAYNDHRLGRVVPASAMPNYDPDVDGDRTVRVITDGVEGGNRDYSKDRGIIDTDVAFPVRKAALEEGVEFSNPGRMVPGWTLERGKKAVLSSIPSMYSRRTQSGYDSDDDDDMEDILQPITPAPKTAGEKRKRKRTRTRDPTVPRTYGKLDDAPSPNLDFPNANITVVEILCFCPQWLKSWDVIDRFISNGARAETLARIINYHRDMPRGPVASNSTLRMMQTPVKIRWQKEDGSAEDSRWNQWFISKHQPPEGWDETDLSTRGFRTPRVTHPRRESGLNQPVNAIPFKDLASGVKAMPAGDDTLDLVRCIQYSQAHPRENWFFPNDFSRLVRCLGGPMPIREAHEDRMAFERWGQNRPAAAATTRNRNKTNTRFAKNTVVDSEEKVDFQELVQVHARTRAQSKKIVREAKAKSQKSDIDSKELEYDHLDGGNTTDEETSADDDANDSGSDSPSKRRKLLPVPRVGRSIQPPNAANGQTYNQRRRQGARRRLQQPTPAKSTANGFEESLMVDPALDNFSSNQHGFFMSQHQPQHDMGTIDPALLTLNQRQLGTPSRQNPGYVSDDMIDPQLLGLGGGNPQLAPVQGPAISQHPRTHVYAQDEAGRLLPVDRDERDPRYFDRHGFQYLHTIPIILKGSDDSQSENIRWARRVGDPDQLFTELDHDAVTAIRGQTGWVSEETRARRLVERRLRRGENTRQPMGRWY